MHSEITLVYFMEISPNITKPAIPNSLAILHEFSKSIYQYHLRLKKFKLAIVVM